MKIKKERKKEKHTTTETKTKIGYDEEANIRFEFVSVEWSVPVGLFDMRRAAIRKRDSRLDSRMRCAVAHKFVQKEHYTASEHRRKYIYIIKREKNVIQSSVCSTETFYISIIIDGVGFFLAVFFFVHFLRVYLLLKVCSTSNVHNEISVK